jgi:hypothetical protein
MTTTKDNTLDLTQFQNKSLNEATSIEFLHSLQANSNTVFGIKSRDRNLDPSMNKIFTWGYEAPMKSDYTKDNAQIANKIRKSNRIFISEVQDNYRNPKIANDKDLLFNYFDAEQKELWKWTFYNRELDKENTSKLQSEYK